MKLRLINFPRNLVLSLSLSRSRHSTLIFANNAFFLLSPPRSVHGGHPPFSRSQGLRESVSIRLCRLEDWNNFNIQGSSDREKWRILTSVTEKQRWVERRRWSGVSVISRYYVTSRIYRSWTETGSGASSLRDDGLSRSRDWDKGSKIYQIEFFISSDIPWIQVLY